MKYSELEDVVNFHRNMRRTPWLKLFPHWWDEKDALLNAIGDEVERVKAQAIFALLNAGIKPPVLLWQESLNNKKYNVQKNITKLPADIKIDAPLYKTWGKITLINNTEKDIDGLELMLDAKNGLIINQLISQNDKIVINLYDNTVSINGKKTKAQKKGQGMPYFITSQNYSTHISGTPLHNEVIRIHINTDTNLEETIVSNTVNITEKVESWEVTGDAYQENPDDADPWIIIEGKGRIGYELDFNNIKEITFWYKAEDEAELSCYCNNKGIFNKKINDEWTYYQIDASDIYGTGKIEFDSLQYGSKVYLNDIKYQTEEKYNFECDIDVDVELDNAVFINEQNIEITSLELIPIEKVELYAYYDFPFNKGQNGWKKVYQKVYEENTNVIYDMITTHFPTKEFYVDVWFKTLQYPYKVGFPCYKDAEPDSMYHVNNRLDTHGEELGLERRMYKTDIAEEDYPTTYPIFYPFDIEQDYWYYLRLINEYTWNDLSINDIDVTDTDGNAMFRLYSINPFCDDFVVHAQSSYPTDKNKRDCNNYTPTLVSQRFNEGYKQQASFSNVINILTKDDDAAFLSLTNQNGPYIDTKTYQSKELWTYFDLSDLPEDVNIDNIEVEIEAESTDNKTNKYTTKDTGILIPNFSSNENYFIPFTTESSYQLRKQVLNYSTTKLQDYIKSNESESGHEHIEQKAVIGDFSGKVKDFIDIPFILYENGEIVNDITTVYLYYNKNLKQGSFIEKNNKTYIHAYVPDVAIMDKITIICKSATHKTFTTTIDIAKKNKYKEYDGRAPINSSESEIHEGNTEIEDVEYQYIEGPLINDEPTVTTHKYAWRTDDFRNLLQKEGLYFRAVFQNDDEQSSTSIMLYNITLKICYSDKKDNFELYTYINTENTQPPIIGTYEIEVANTGEKPINKIIDIITPPNLKMAKNNIYVSLGVNQTSEKQYIDIQAEYPLADGYYDITTICEDKIKTNSIQIFSDGLIETGVKIQPHHGKYYDTIKLSADVYAIDNSKIHAGANKVAFYINGYMVGQPVQVLNGHAEIEVIPGQYKFVDTGVLTLEAHYLGNIQYKSSRNYSTIFISKSNTRITLTASDVAIYQGAYQIEARVEYFNGEEYLPVNDGEVIFYIDDEILSANSTFINGIFTTQIASLENPAGEYVLRAEYSGSDIYSSAETSQNFEIVGGEAKISIFNVKAKPTDIITFKATVRDINNKTIPYGFLDFYISENDDSTPKLIQKNVKIKDGIATTDPWQDTTVLTTDDERQIYTIIAKYHGAEGLDIYRGEGIGSLIIEKGEVIIEYQTRFYASTYEPLGFFMRIKDANTHEYISDGTISITLPKQNNLILTNNVDEDGGVRIVHNPISFTAKEWKELNKFSFTTAGDITSRQQILINDTTIPDDIGLYDKDELYMIYDGDVPYNAENPSIDFMIENNELYYVGEREDKEHIFIGENGRLYARTALDSLRQYEDGLQDIIINYSSEQKYKPKKIFIENGLNIYTQSIDLDIHAYDISYSYKDDITCYVTKYDTNDNQITNANITTGEVQFYIDDAMVQKADVTNGIAILDKTSLYDIKAGNHLLSVRFCRTKDTKVTKTYSYETLLLRKETPIITLDIDRITKNRKSNIYVIISGGDDKDISLSGLINLYMDDVLIDSQYLYGNEQIPGLVDVDSINDLELLDTQGAYFAYIMPDDIDVNSHTLKVVYEGNDYFTSATTERIIKQEPAQVDISVRHLKDSTLYIALNNECTIDVDVSMSDDIINEGKIVLLHGEELIAEGAVVNNIATLTWTQNVETNYQCTLSYTDGQNYINKKDEIINIKTIDALDEITIPNEKCTTLHEALRCIKNNGTIYIEDDIILDRELNIKKDCNIIGLNDSRIIKDAIDLIINENSIYTYNTGNMDIYQYHEIEGLTINNLNTNNFVIQDKKLYFKSDNKLKEIYLFENDKFYSDTLITLDNLNTNINIKIDQNATVHIDNIIFTSNDIAKRKDFLIENNGRLIINRSILEYNVELRNNNKLTAQRNFMYCTCRGEGDLNNNWWGSNTPPYDVDSHIIITVDSDTTPAVLSENVNIVGRMIGSNGRKYDLPSTTFAFHTDTEGYFSIDSGMLTNQEAHTIFMDGIKEGNVFFTVDNETVSCQIYEYERKTEVIIDEIHAIPIHYQIPITAKVQSCADIFYTFSEDSDGIKIDKGTENINTGNMYFYINGQQLGHVPVKNGEASIDVFFTDQYYNINQDYTIKAVYKPTDYYFESSDEFTTQLINDNEDVCYVSSSGKNTNTGTYSYPVKTLQQAINLDKSTIYILDDFCKDNSILINHNVIIKAYKNQSTFNKLSGSILFDIPEDKTLFLENINFINNSFTYLFNNQGSLYVDKCIFSNNNNTLFNKNTGLYVTNSAIVDNTNIIDDLKSNNFTYCWFGTNTPKEDINDNIDNYVKMDVESSKDVLYIGTLAHITGKLTSYVSNDVEYKLENKLPLRIAKFSSTGGSMKPLYDYTYDNKSTSLLNTYEPQNSTQYTITLQENKNYQSKDVILKARISNVYNDIENSSNNKIIFEISGTNIDIEKTVKKINNNIASVNIGELPLGTYNLKCSLYKNNSIYVADGQFTVQKPDVIVHKFNISNNDNLYYTDIDILLKDNFNNLINDEIISIDIDGQKIGSYIIQNGVLQRRLSYSLLSAGEHTMTIYNNSKYEKFSSKKTFIVKKKNTTILFPYNNIEAHVPNNLLITVVDDDGNNVQEGTITVYLNDDIIINSQALVNGVVKINNFKINDIGQYSISIYYTGDEDHYNESLFINNAIGVGIFNVKFGISEDEYIESAIGKPFNFQTTIVDVSGQSINHGYVNLYIDDILLNQTGIPVNNGFITYNDDLPINIASGIHTFTIEYIDKTNVYLDTILNTFLRIDKVPTNIYMNPIHGNPGQKSIVPYQINSDYGIITSGTLIAKYNDTIIGTAQVTDGIFNQIEITIPFLPAEEEYELLLEYKDDNNNYQDSSTNVRLIMDKNEVLIEPSHTQYYPDTTFHFAGYFKDADNNIINVGKASLYIDDVEEAEPQDVINGQIMLPITLHQAKTYKMTIVYEENEYYHYTRYDFKFNIDELKINDIHFENTIKTKENNENEIIYEISNDVINTLPNQLIDANIIFDTLDNYNVKDGIISVYLDGQNINNYYVAESNKNMPLKIGNERKGTHTLTLEYYDSNLFEDYTEDKAFNFTLNIISQKVSIKVNNQEPINVISHNDIIDINTYLSKNVDGIIKYYIGLPKYEGDEGNNITLSYYDYKFIGLQEITKQDMTYQYQLPTQLLDYAIENVEKVFKIKAVFTGNNHYDEASDEVDLIIHKEDCNITFIKESINAYYKETINVDFNIDVENNPLIHFYIDNKMVGSVVATNQHGTFKYKMHSDMIAKSTPYILTAVFEGSAVNNATESHINIEVAPMQPKIDKTDKKAYIGGQLELNNKLTDTDNVVVEDTGTLHYSIMSKEIDCSLNQTKYLSLPLTFNQANEDLLVSYVPGDMTKYSGFTNEKIVVHMLKNDIQLNIDVPEKVSRGETFDITIHATSETTDIPINVPIRLPYDNNNKNITNGILESSITIPLNSDDVDMFDLEFFIEGNDIFNEMTKTIKIYNYNQPSITINTNKAQSMTNAHTLEQAINLVSDYGNIELITPIDNQEVTLNKSINFNGNNKIVKNWQITNEANEVTISSLRFTTEDDTTSTHAIIDNGEIIIDNCTFKNTKDSALLINKKATITNCTFNSNNATNGGAIYISNKNYKTIISHCTFKGNNATLYGGAIYSDKGNNVEISYSSFYANKAPNSNGASISFYGNMFLNSNTFYSNTGLNEVHMISGSLEANMNLFNGTIQSIFVSAGDIIDADLNYWGYNTINDIESHNPNIEINNWLISQRKDYNKQIQGENKHIIVGEISQYLSRLEKDIVSIEPIIADLPVMIGNTPYKLNEEIIANKDTTIKIGQQRFVGDSND